MVNYSIPYHKRQVSYWLISYERRLSHICFNKNPYSKNEKGFLNCPNCFSKLLHWNIMDGERFELSTTCV